MILFSSLKRIAYANGSLKRGIFSESHSCLMGAWFLVSKLVPLSSALACHGCLNLEWRARLFVSR